MAKGAPRKRKAKVQPKSPPPQPVARRMVWDTDRPMAYSEDLASEICERLANGETLNSITKDPRMPQRTMVMRWVQNDVEGFKERYEAANHLKLDYWSDDITDIADDDRRDIGTDDNGNEAVDWQHIQRARLRVDTRKWLLSKLRPEKYGEKLYTENKSQVEHSVSKQFESLLGAFAEVRKKE